MIDTFIFDIGNVLVEFNWRETFSQIFDSETADIIAKATVLDGEKWNTLDRGTLTYEELIKSFTENAPGYEKEIRYGIDEIYEHLHVFDYSAPWLKSLKEKGYKVYILSNFGDYTFNRSKPHFEFLNYTDGALISYEVNLLKPEREIYDALCKKFDIIPENAVFFDDNEKNIEGAKAYGLNGIVFENFDQAVAELGKLELKFN